MTLLKLDELAQLNSLDQVLLWCLVSINDANIDSRNTFISDNAGVRAESANYIQWNITQDDKGRGKFLFTALLPVVNPNPLQDKASLLERVWSYSPYEPRQEFDAGITGFGYGVPALPDWVDTSERLLAYVSIFAAAIGKYARLTKGDEAFWAPIKPEYWADVKYQIADSAYGGTMSINGQMSIDWNSYLEGKSLLKCLNPYSGHASDINCNFPLLDLLWAIPAVDLTLPPEDIMPLILDSGEFFVDDEGTIIGGENSADSLIESYTTRGFDSRDTPDWYLDALNNPQGINLDTITQGDGWGSQSLGDKAPQLIESLGVCKEQDPNMTSFTF